MPVYMEKHSLCARNIVFENQKDIFIWKKTRLGKIPQDRLPPHLGIVSWHGPQPKKDKFVRVLYKILSDDFLCAWGEKSKECVPDQQQFLNTHTI